MTTIIAFAGRKQSGKTTSAEFIIQNVFKQSSLGDCQIYNFADTLKMLCIDVLGLSYNQCYGSDKDKNELVDCYWDNKQLTAREVLQIIGTDVFRKMQNNVWSDATINRIKKDNLEMAIIADCRFPNEVESIKRVGGIVIKLERNPYNSSHISETALDPDQYNQSLFDLVIDNRILNIEQQNNQILEFLQRTGLSYL